MDLSELGAILSFPTNKQLNTHLKKKKKGNQSFKQSFALVYGLQTTQQERGSENMLWAHFSVATSPTLNVSLELPSPDLEGILHSLQFSLCSVFSIVPGAPVLVIPSMPGAFLQHSLGLRNLQVPSVGVSKSSHSLLYAQRVKGNLRARLGRASVSRWPFALLHLHPLSFVSLVSNRAP